MTAMSVRDNNQIGSKKYTQKKHVLAIGPFVVFICFFFPFLRPWKQEEIGNRQ